MEDECRLPSAWRTTTTSQAPECRRKHEVTFAEILAPIESRPRFDEMLVRKSIAGCT
jgi:hypothetical protein